MTQEVLKQALEALEANDQLINGSGTKGGLVYCMDGYYSDCFDVDPINKQTDEAIAAIKEALAQPEQEPVADALHFAQWTAAKKDLSDYICIGELTLAGIEDNLEGLEFGESEIERFEAVIESLQENLVTGRECKKVPLIAYIGENNITPPQRTWAGLTDEEMELTFLECGGKWNGDFWKIEDADFHPFLRTIEAKLKERNT